MGASHPASWARAPAVRGEGEELQPTQPAREQDTRQALLPAWAHGQTAAPLGQLRGFSRWTPPRATWVWDGILGTMLPTRGW